jgi:hypothetical protein
LPCPRDDRVEDDGGAEDERELVVASGKAAPVLDVGVAAFDDVALTVVGFVEGDRPSAA